MKSLLKRLLSYLHSAVFDKRPHGLPALRVNHPTLPASWVVSDDTLTVTAGEDVFAYDIGSVTVAQLVTALQADGFLVGDISPDFSSLSAAVLVESTTASESIPQPLSTQLEAVIIVDFSPSGDTTTLSISPDKTTFTGEVTASQDEDFFVIGLAASNLIDVSTGQRLGFYYKINPGAAKLSYGYYTGFMDILPVFSEPQVIPQFFAGPGWYVDHVTGEARLEAIGNIIGEADLTVFTPAISFVYDETTEFCLAYEDGAGPYGTLYFYTSNEGLIASHEFTQPHDPAIYLSLSLYSRSDAPFAASNTMLNDPSVTHAGVTQLGGASLEPQFLGGPALHGFTNLLYSFLSGYAREVRALRQQIPEAIKQMVIPDAEDEWLDLHGGLYNVPRRQGESDVAFAPRIPEEVFRKRINAMAIEQAVLDITGKDIVIEEPWGSMLRLDVSQLSGGDAFYSGGEIGYHLLRPVSYVPITWEDVLPVIERNRAAGVVVLPPETRIRDLVSAVIDGTVLTGKTAIYSEIIPAWDANRLSLMVLSGETIARNYSSITETRTYSLVMPGPDDIYSESSEITGYTWLEMGGWLEVPWSISETEMEALLAAPDGFSDYVNITLPGDMP